MTKRLISFYWNNSTRSWEARCQACKQLCGVVTEEAVLYCHMRVPLFVPHECAVEREVTGL